jgi:glutamate synthase domain-containing protein 1
MFGYKCTLQTDTEVITYILDYLVKKQGLTLTEAAHVIAAPFWKTIEGEKDEKLKEQYAYLRTVFPSLLVTGPFSIILGFTGGVMALNDRLKLRSMVVGEKDDKVFIASEEAAIRAMEPDAENVWAPSGGEPVIVNVKEGAF